MSLKFLPTQEKNFLILWVGGINFAIAIIVAIEIEWPLLFLIPILPIVFSLLMFDKSSNNPCPSIIFFLSKKFYKYSYNIINLKLRNSTSSDYIISPHPNYSRWRTCYFVCLIPFLCSIAVSSKTFGLEVINSGSSISSNSNIIVSSIFFIPLFLFIGIALSIVDTSNLYVTSKRGYKLVVDDLRGFIPILAAIQIIFVLFSSDKIEFVVNLMRMLTLFAILHTPAILYIVFLEKNYVEKFRKYLINEGVGIKS